MKINTIKFWSLIGALCAATCSVALEAQYNGHTSSPKKKTQKTLEKKGTYQRGTYREITPNAGPRVKRGADVFLTADYILWKIVQNGDEFAQTGVVVNTTTNSLPEASKGTLKNGNTHWKSGFRVGLGLNLNHDGWDLFAEYTWIRGKGKDSIKNPGAAELFSDPGGVLAANRLTVATDVPINRSFQTSALFDEAKTKEHIRYNVVNLELGRNFYISQFLMLRPHFGFSGTWQRFRQTNTFKGGNNVYRDADSNPTILITDYKERYNNKYWGVGIRAGLDTAWHFTARWSLFGDIAWTAMWSCYDLSRKDSASGTHMNSQETSSATLFNSNPGHNYIVNYVGEFEIGLRWEIWFNRDNYHFSIQTGWYENVWINHMAFIKIENSLVYENMSMHGLDVKLRFDF